MLFQQREEAGARDEDALRVLERDGGRGEWPAFVRRGGAKRIAGTEDLQDHFLACRRGLVDLHPARHDRDEEVRGLAFTEDRAAFLIAVRARDLGQALPVGGLEAAERRAEPQQICDGRGHG